MLSASLVLFGIAALGGLLLAYFRIARSANPPLGLALGHGLIAAAGLVLLIIAIVSNQLAGKAFTALVLFIIAALGGFIMITLHFRGRLIPLPVVLIHALVAVAGFIMLYMGKLAYMLSGV